MDRNSEPKEINVLFNDGGLGDNIARIPVLNYLLQTYPNLTIHAFFHDYFIPVAQNYTKTWDKSRLFLYKWSEAEKYYNEKLVTKSFKHAAFHNLSMHMTEHAYTVVCNTLPEEKHWYNYPKLDLAGISLQKFGLPKEYVVVTTAFTAPVREFLPEHVNKIVAYLKSQGKEIVFLGQKKTTTGTSHTIVGNLSDDVDFSQGLDLIDKTTLLEAAKVLSEAQLVVGLDNGLVHLAACSDVPVVCGFTTVKPEHRAPYRNDVKSWNFHSVVPPQSLECRFCQSTGIFDVKQDFRFCKFKDNLCTKVLDADLYIEEIKKVLK